MCGFDLEALDTFTVGSLTVEDGGNAIFWNGEQVALSPAQRLIVTALARDAGHCIKRPILAEVIGYEGDDINIIAVLLNRIMRSFRRIDDKFDRIESVWATGLRWRLA